MEIERVSFIPWRELYSIDGEYQIPGTSHKVVIRKEFDAIHVSGVGIDVVVKNGGALGYDDTNLWGITEGYLAVFLREEK